MATDSSLLHYETLHQYRVVVVVVVSVYGVNQRAVKEYQSASEGEKIIVG